MEELRGEWEYLRQRLAEYPGEDKKKAEILTTVGNVLAREDTRVIEECIAQLTELMDAGEFLKENDAEWRRWTVETLKSLGA